MIESYRARLGTESLHGLALELINTVDYARSLRRAYRETKDAEARWTTWKR